MQHGYEINDLYETDIGLFLKEAESWNISPLLSNIKVSEIHLDSNKAPELILGGPNILNPALSDSESNNNYLAFERIYTGLPKHDYVTFFGKFWYFGFGDLSKVEGWPFSISLWRSLSRAEKAAEPVLNATFQRRNITENEANFDYIKMGNEHIENHLILEIYIYNPKKDDTRSFGFRDLTIHFSNYSGNRENKFFSCHVSVDSNTLPGLYDCKCPFNQGLNASSLCQDCADNCASCYGAKPSQCVACNPEGRWNGKECSKCHWNCKTCTGPSQYECTACNYGFYDYGNGTCQETCEWPWSPTGYYWPGLKCMKICLPSKFIWSGCDPSKRSSKDFDGCVDECKPPLISYITENDILVCENPCHKKDRLLSLYWNGTCGSSCPMPLREVYNPYSRLCENPCEVASQYLYPNRSCLDTCPAPLLRKSDPGVNYCFSPCNSANLYLYQNGSCHFNCRLPFRTRIEHGVRHCLPPCDLEKEFILKNGSCSGVCPAPLVRRAELGVGVHCLSPCENDGHFVMKNNGSCLLNCPNFFHVKIENGVKYCLKRCGADEYYFENNKSCLQRCPYPLLKVKSDGIDLCKSPCSKLDDFIYDDQSCHKNCLRPLISLTEPGEIGKYCKSPCNKGSEYLNIDGDCQERCEYPYKIIHQGSYQMCLINLSPTQIDQINSIKKIVKASNTASEIGGLLSTLINAGDPTSIFMMPLLNMLEMMKYTKITLPGNIKLSLNQGEDRLLQNYNLQKREDQELFENQQNIFDEKILRIGIFCAITFILSGTLKMITPVFNGSKATKVLQEWSFALQWNILASFFISSIGEITFYSLLELNHFGIRYRLLISMFGILPIMIFVIYKIIRVNTDGTRREVREDPEERQRWRFIFETYKDDRLYQRLFVLIYLIRVVSVSIIIGILSDYPLIQAILLVFLNLGMLSYLFCASPIKKKSSFIQHIIVEIALLLNNFLLVILAVVDGSQSSDIDVKNAIGQLMTILYLIAPILTGIIIMIKLLKNIFALFFKTSSESGFIQLSEINRDEESDVVLNNESVQESSRMTMTEIDEANDDLEDASIEPSPVLV